MGGRGEVTEKRLDGELMSVPQVLAELGGVSRRTFYRWRERGVAPPCLILPNGELRFRRGDFRDWLDGLRDGAA
jgi:predicted DNA-binding transcriptional regulator AlpA